MDTTRALLNVVQDLYTQEHSAYWLPPVVSSKRGILVGRIQPGDAVIFCCRRGEREIQLTDALTDPDFSGFQRKRVTPLTFVPLTQYHPRFAHFPTAFSSDPIKQTLGEVVSHSGHVQLRMAEAEKFAHVTYFINGKYADAFHNEFRAPVASDSADPLNSLQDLVDLIPKKFDEYNPSLTIINLATGDLLGHSDSLAIKKNCASAVDKALGTILQLARKRKMWTVITADHGLLEDHGPTDGPINTSHTTNLVPFIAINPHGSVSQVRESGTLADVAPTILSLLGIPKPPLMTGESLLEDPPSAESPVLLLVLDGWGLGVDARINPIRLADTPNWDRLRHSPMAKLAASGIAVGLVAGTKGNSESGHMAIGAGRVVQQDDSLIEHAIATGAFAEAPAFITALEDVQSRGSALHLIGLLSRSSSHGSIDYVLELVRLASQKGIEPVYLHLITDGRSSRSERLPIDLEQIGRDLSEIGTGTVVTLVGRGFALDRGGEYEKNTRRAYEALVDGKGILAEVEDS
jgi:2,3-bisphosphoglycerate-independent phosphoglycerate mutase